MIKKIALVLLSGILACLSFAAQAQEAKDITAECTITHPGRKTGSLIDRSYMSYWKSKEMRGPAVEVTTPDGVQAQYLYICFGDMPDAWAIEEETGGEWRTLIEGTNEYAHVFLNLGGKTHFRLIETSGRTVQFKINEMFVFSDGDVPDWVQRWEPSPEKADLLLLVAHPDDELIFFGGTVPTYAAERDYDVLVAYMCYSNTTRRSELLNGLWAMGLRKYPVIGTFYDTYTSKLDDAYSRWRKSDVRRFVMDIVRRYRPEVLVTHDVEGEYGHGAHRLCADVARYCVENGADASVFSESAQLYGTWQVKKLYLHLYPENPIEMDWRVPLDAFGGKTGLELAQEAYLLHATQQRTDFTVTDEGETSNARFGLAYSAVGPDVLGGDFMENIAPKGPTPVPTATPEPTPTPKPTPEPTPEPTRVPREKVHADVAWPATLEDTPKDAAGYPLEGEHVYQSEEEGLWFYASPTLVVRIDRIFDEQAVRTWYEAHVFCDTEKERLGAVLHNEENPRKEHVQPRVIAREKQVVFGMNTDYYTYRVGRKTITGMVIRGRNVFFDRVPEANRGQFPNLDTLAMYEDGNWDVFHSDELTAQEYLDAGAIDVFSFGPYLIRDGEMNPFLETMKNGLTDQPRCAIGMIEPGHYYAILVEGRIRNVSVGCGIPFMAENMREKGCVQAFNLDGGRTGVMCFMGEQITRIAKYQGSTAPRATTELIGIGHSDLIDPDAK